jgi:chemotaxis protein CheX
MSAALKMSHALTDKEFINAFIQAVINTHKITAMVDVVPGKPSISQTIVKHGEVTGFVGIVSNDMKWILSISYEKATACSIYNNMFGENKADLDNEVSDLVGEITNQVYCGAKILLNQRGYAFEMALPTVISGDFRTRHHGAGVTLSIPFHIGDQKDSVYIDITVEK